MMALNEADTRAKLVDPKLHESGWREEMIERDKPITRGRILNETGDRAKPKKPDYILYYPDKSGIPIAVIEAESEAKSSLDGMQQAKEYREMLEVPFAYSTNGHEIEEFDWFSKKQIPIERFPSPEELWGRYVEQRGPKPVEVEDPLLYPYYPFPDKLIRYYQEVAVRKIIEAILNGKKKLLLTMATGSGKTYVAFQATWKLFKTKKIRRVLYLVDRVFLREQAYQQFSPFGDAREELVETKEINKNKDIYFATYQTLYSERNGKRIYEHFEPDFFDMVIIDECHRSGWNRWHEILRHFSKAIHFGMTATPKRDDNIDTYAYFGEPVYSYPMSRGIEDGFLAPFEIRRIFTNIDKSGKLSISEAVSFGAKIEVPPGVELKEEYSAREFEREITVPERTKLIAGHIAKILESTGPKNKTVIFCVSQSHAAEVAKEMNNYFAPRFGVDNYAVRVVAEEQDSHKNIKKMRDSETDFPVIATTVDLLSTGVDIPPVKNIVFLQYINSKVVFHQIIGRGSRIDEASKKFAFRIIDFTGASRLIDDWDIPSPESGETARGPFDYFLKCQVIDAETGLGISNASVVVLKSPSNPIHVKTNGDGFFTLSELPRGRVRIDVSASGYRRKETTIQTFPSPEQIVSIALAKEVKEKKPLIKVKNLEVYITEENTLRIDMRGRVLTDAEYIQYCKDGLVKKFLNLAQLKALWKDREKRLRLKQELEESGINLSLLANLLKQPDADDFDVIAHLVFDAPPLTRDERAQRIKLAKEFIEGYGPEAREVILEIVDRVRRYGTDELARPHLWRTPPFDKFGFLKGVARIFGGVDKLKEALYSLERMYYPEFGGL
jgi:type I restriction enzyme R subunit